MPYGREVDGHALGDVRHGGLRRPVGHHAGARVDGSDRGVVDDGASPAVLHVPRRTLGTDDDPEEVDAHDAREVVEVVREEPLERAADPRVVEHDVQAARSGRRRSRPGPGPGPHRSRRSLGKRPHRQFADATSCPRSTSTSPITTFAPSATSSSAVARPIPPAPPVTMATFPASSCGLMPRPYDLGHQSFNPVICLDARVTEDAGLLQLFSSNV